MKQRNGNEILMIWDSERRTILFSSYEMPSYGTLVKVRGVKKYEKQYF